MNCPDALGIGAVLFFTLCPCAPAPIGRGIPVSRNGAPVPLCRFCAPCCHRAPLSALRGQSRGQSWQARGRRTPVITPCAPVPLCPCAPVPLPTVHACPLCHDIRGIAPIGAEPTRTPAPIGAPEPHPHPYTRPRLIRVHPPSTHGVTSLAKVPL